jgi:hypothetical protein
VIKAKLRDGQKSEVSMAAESNFIGQENEGQVGPEENPT